MARHELERIIGRGNILFEQEALEEYSQDSSLAPRVKPQCAVKPRNVDEVQGIVRWANQTLTPLVPVSSGPPHSRGDTVPGMEGAVIVDLSRMKRIIRIDPRNKIAMVEPGVTYGELQIELEKEGLCAYMPLAPRRSKSVIGSLLEREPITMPAHHWDSTDPLLCAEVVYGTGDRFRTGEASGPDTVEEQWEIGRVQMNPFGHAHVDFQRLIAGAQGTMGIVTWATLKCSYLSEISRALLVSSASLESLIELAYKVLRVRLGGRLFILNGLNLACLLGGDGGAIEELWKKLPPWVLFISFEGYGVFPEEKVACEEVDFRDMVTTCSLKSEGEIPGARADEILRLLSRPSPEPYWRTRFQGGGHDIFFLTTLDRTPELATAMSGLARRHDYPVENMGVYLQPIVQGTSCHCEFNLYYDPSRASEVETVRQLDSAGSEAMAEMGGFFSRPYGAWADIAYRHAAGTRVMQRKLKEIFDPREILNPGKLGF